MFWKIIENAIASAMSRTMLEARFDALFDRVRRMGVLGEAEIERLRAEMVQRLRDVEREGRELKSYADRMLQSFAERLLRARSGRDDFGSAGGPDASVVRQPPSPASNDTSREDAMAPDGVQPARDADPTGKESQG